jgi:hypothetical protein
VIAFFPLFLFSKITTQAKKTTGKSMNRGGVKVTDKRQANLTGKKKSRNRTASALN